MSHPKILVIDDEPQIRKLLEITLETNDYAVILADTGLNGQQLAKSHGPDLILLDIGLPDISGQTVLKNIREWYLKPVIMLSVQSAEEEIVKALDSGANDYLIKPFRSGELLARIRSAMRGVRENPGSEKYVNGNLVIDFSRREVFRDKNILKLTSIEYKLLTLMAKNEGRVLTHDFLLKEIWGPHNTEQTQYLRVFMAQLRKKIEEEPNHPKYILTESGVGYRFNNMSI